MRMIDKIIRAMQDTGLIDGISVEDCDTLATAALESLLAHNEVMRLAGALASDKTQDEVSPSTAGVIFKGMIDAALNE